MPKFTAAIVVVVAAPGMPYTASCKSPQPAEARRPPRRRRWRLSVRQSAGRSVRWCSHSTSLICRTYGARTRTRAVDERRTGEMTSGHGTRLTRSVGRRHNPVIDLLSLPVPASAASAAAAAAAGEAGCRTKRPTCLCGVRPSDRFPGNVRRRLCPDSRRRRMTKTPRKKTDVGRTALDEAMHQIPDDERSTRASTGSGNVHIQSNVISSECRNDFSSDPSIVSTYVDFVIQ